MLISPNASSNYSTITTENLWFLFNIKLNCRIDLTKFIMDDMVRTIQGDIKNLLYGMLISEIIDYFNVDTRCDPSKNHALFNLIDEHSIKKLDFEFRNNNWSRKGAVNNPIFDEEENKGESSAYRSGLFIAQPSAPISTTFDVEQAFIRLFLFMKTMDFRLTTRMNLVEVQNHEMLKRQKDLKDPFRSQVPHHHAFSLETFILLHFWIV
ncbi:Uncharacterized protein TCM_014250 [Theobroma cacao]|uniref:Uncharacterized protein n=1 Tax=Theobroma cacao TaxID=3641 RepID=A0A061G4U5_THECC|nr:Uncharacterized protein TCM_014250 [Theobroma cacao]